jgi:hypothetical protein
MYQKGRMRSQLILTIVWLVSFIVAVAVLESYVHVTNSDGKFYILPDDRDAYLPVITGTYSLYLAGVLAFWFIKPFRAPRGHFASRSRFSIALACTLFFNLTILFFISHPYITDSKHADVSADFTVAMHVARWMSFIVAPVNLFYFGSRVQPQGT